MKKLTTKVTMLVSVLVALLGVVTSEAGWAIPRFDLGDFAQSVAREDAPARSLTVNCNPTLCKPCRSVKQTTAKTHDSLTEACKVCATCGTKAKAGKT